MISYDSTAIRNSSHLVTALDGAFGSSWANNIFLPLHVDRLMTMICRIQHAADAEDGDALTSFAKLCFIY